MFKRTISLFLFLITAASLLSAAAFTNGSFEVNTGGACSPNVGGYATLGVGSTCLPGWTIADDTIDYINGYWAAADGTHSVDMDGVTNGSIRQTFDTISGTQYLVMFSMAGNTDSGPVIKPLHVDAAGQSQDYTFDITGFSAASMGWTTKSFSFTAISSSTDLTFTSTNSETCCWGAALDNVSVAAVATPEPATWGLLASAVAAMVTIRRRRR